MSASEPYTDKDIREWEAIVADPDLSSEYPRVVSRMLATIRDRDGRIAALEAEKDDLWDEAHKIRIERDTLAVELVRERDSAPVLTHDTRRAEAFALYNSFIGSGNIGSESEWAEAAIESAASFAAEWEKQHG